MTGLTKIGVMNGLTVLEANYPASWKRDDETGTLVTS